MSDLPCRQPESKRSADDLTSFSLVNDRKGNVLEILGRGFQKNWTKVLARRLDLLLLLQASLALVLARKATDRGPMSAKAKGLVWIRIVKHGLERASLQTDKSKEIIFRVLESYDMIHMNKYSHAGS